MRIDEYGTIELEQCSWPGSIGDSCAETARYAHLLMLNGEYRLPVLLNRFITHTGYIRHPTAPDGWRESDFSSDQALPLYLALKRNAAIPELLQAESRLRWRTGNGQLVSPALFFAIRRLDVMFSLVTLAQVALFKLPWRWSDERHWFERSEGSSADYLNWLHCAVYCPRWIRRLISADLLKQKIADYYKPEPNSAFLLSLYNKIIEKYW